MAYQKRLEQEDRNAWLHGGYILDAIRSCIDKKYNYPEQPYGIGNSGNPGLSDEERFLLWIDVYNRQYDSRNNP